MADDNGFITQCCKISENRKLNFEIVPEIVNKWVIKFLRERVKTERKRQPLFTNKSFMFDEMFQRHALLGKK